MIWVMEHAPINSPAEGMVLYALADRASDDGTAAWPSMQWIADRACCSRQTVRRHLRAMEERGLIRRGDQNLVSHLRHDKRPVVWDLDLGLDRLAGYQIDTPSTGAGYQIEPSGVSNQTERGITGDTQTILNHPKNQGRGVIESLLSQDETLAPPESHFSTPPAAPSSPSDTPDRWSTAEDPRCRKHAALPRDRVPACRSCAQAREWFEERATAAVEARRALIDGCGWCDENGLAWTRREDGQAVAVRCSHERAPVLVA